MISRTRATRFRELSEVFAKIKAEDDLALHQNRVKLFVSNNATTAIRRDSKFIFVGRKGSGKTALVYDFVESTKESYNIHLTIEKDKAPHWLLYHFYYKQFSEAQDKFAKIIEKHSKNKKIEMKNRDLNEIFDPVTLFSMAWTAAIQICIVDALVTDKKAFDQDQFKSPRQILQQYLEETFAITQEPSSRISESIDEIITAVCDLIQARIEDFLSIKVPSLGVLLSRIAKWGFGEPTNRIVPPHIDKIIRELLRDSQIRVLVSMDKYDDLVDELILEIDNMRRIKELFPHDSATPDFQSGVKLSMLLLQKNMLKGLLLACRKLREDVDYKNVHFALAIPDDRFAELELREGANLNISHVERIHWNPLELTEIFVRRCASVLESEGISIDLNLRDAKQLERGYLKLMQKLELPLSIAHSRLRSVKEDLLFYIIRHTLGRLSRSRKF